MCAQVTASATNRSLAGQAPFASALRRQAPERAAQATGQIPNRHGDRVMERQVRATASGITRLSFTLEKFGRP
jgi:hypothetical protein